MVGVSGPYEPMAPQRARSSGLGPWGRGGVAGRRERRRCGRSLDQTLPAVPPGVGRGRTGVDIENFDLENDLATVPKLAIPSTKVCASWIYYRSGLVEYAYIWKSQIFAGFSL